MVAFRNDDFLLNAKQMVEREDPACRLRSHELLHDQKNKSAAIDHFFFSPGTGNLSDCRSCLATRVFTFQVESDPASHVQYSTYIDYYCRVGSR